MEIFKESYHIGRDALSSSFVAFPFEVEEWHQTLSLFGIACNLNFDVVVGLCAKIEIDKVVEICGTVYVGLNGCEWLDSSLLILNFSHVVNTGH